MNDLISIIIINWNGKKWLKDCFKSLGKQTYKNFEIIFVDNASSDDSIAYIKKFYPKTKIVQNKTNRGFAGGNNDGLKVANGNYILLLNNDTCSPKDFLKNFIKAFDEIPKAGCIQSQILLMDSPEKLDLCGSYWTDSTFLYYFGFGKNKDNEKYKKATPVFSCKGASMMVKREVIDKVGFFDDDFWNYYEETDFCHRVWIAGYECWYYPKALVYHALGGTSTKLNDSLLQFHNFKNKLLSFLKNFESKSLLTIISTYICLSIVLSFVWLFQKRFKHFLSIYKAIGWNIASIDKTLSKRQEVQKLREASDNEIFKKARLNPRLSYYFSMLGDLTKYED